MEPQAIEENNFKSNIIQVVRGKEKVNIPKKRHRAKLQKNGFGKQQTERIVLYSKVMECGGVSQIVADYPKADAPNHP